MKIHEYGNLQFYIEFDKQPDESDMANLAETLSFDLNDFEEFHPDMFVANTFKHSNRHRRILYSFVIARDVLSVIVTTNIYPKGIKVATRGKVMADFAGLPRYSVNPFTSTADEITQSFLDDALKDDTRLRFNVIFN